MEVIKWSKDLEVGIDIIDAQHQMLVKRLSELARAINSRKSNTEIASTLRFIKDYIETHFTLEEKLMQEHAYPQLPEHKEQHLIFTKNFREISDNLEKNGPSLSLALETERTLIKWLLDHIKSIDVAMGSFLKEKLD
jgi:hemerythrin